jgi:hypothetical protein
MSLAIVSCVIGAFVIGATILALEEAAGPTEKALQMVAAETAAMATKKIAK